MEGQNSSVNQLNLVNRHRSGYKTRHYTMQSPVVLLFIMVAILVFALWSMASGGYVWAQGPQFIIAIWLLTMIFVKLFD